VIRTKLIGLLVDKHELTGGHCGTTVADLLNELDCTLDELREVTQDLYSKGMVEFKDGIHGKLVFYTPPKTNGKQEKNKTESFE
jgi:DNA-binding FadR family transcriptional regulator